MNHGIHMDSQSLERLFRPFVIRDVAPGDDAADHLAVVITDRSGITQERQPDTLT